MSTELIIVFTRYPESGRTKTRLIPELGAEGAAQLQKEMTEHVVGRLTRCPTPLDAAMEIRHEGGDFNRMQDWLGAGLEYRPQGDGDLGARLQHAFSEAFSRNSDRVIAIGTDCPDLAVHHLRDGFIALLTHHTILGPTSDGGYYMVGVSRDRHLDCTEALFQKIDWGTEMVLQQSLARLEARNLSHALLDRLDDVDRPEDLEAWRRISSCQ